MTPLSRIRSTTLSPCTSGSVTTLMSTRRPSTVSANRPSWGTRFSAMSRSPMILIRDTTPGTIRRLIVAAGVSTPSTRNSTFASPSSGLTWMSEAPCCTAWAMIECTSLMTGASWSASSASVPGSSSASASACSSTMSSIDSSIPASRVSSRSRSSTEATATRTRRPVIIATSSIVSTFVGSAIASSSVPSSANPTGTAR